MHRTAERSHSPNLNFCFTAFYEVRMQGVEDSHSPGPTRKAVLSYGPGEYAKSVKCTRRSY